MVSKTAFIGIRMPIDLLREIDHLRKESERTRSFIIKKATELYLKEYEDYEIALARSQDPTDPVIPWEEMKKRVRQ